MYSMQPGPRDSLVQCFIKRNRNTQSYHLYLGLTTCKPSLFFFQIYQERDYLFLSSEIVNRSLLFDFLAALTDNGKFLLAASKLKRTTFTDYIISLRSDDISKRNNAYLGRMRYAYKFTLRMCTHLETEWLICFDIHYRYDPAHFT